MTGARHTSSWRDTGVVVGVLALAATSAHPASGDLLISGDFGPEGGAVFSGIETVAADEDPLFGEAAVWNALHLPSTGQSDPVFNNLLDSAGEQTDVSLSIIGSPRGAGSTDLAGTDILTYDAIEFPNSIEWTISGLEAGAEYRMIFYARDKTLVALADYSFRLQLDTTGDGELDTEVGVVTSTSSPNPSYFETVVASGAGEIVGRAFPPEPRPAIGNPNWAGFQLAGASEPDSDGDGVADVDDFCPGTILPELAPASGQLMPNRFALTGEGPGQTFATAEVGQTRESFTIFDTRGCSCEQIVAHLGLGGGHLEHGCSVSAMRSFIDALNAQSQ